eukprot:GHVN01089169.1.p2 GENE.GHVN01089169.1~~GHVN01089169.1.p2  ORF type:complete len:499 (-),score=68.98 GHVN01089169.1:1187-2683(-)
MFYFKIGLAIKNDTLQVIPLTLPRALIAGFIAWALDYWDVVASDVSGGSLMYHPSPFTFFFQIAAFVLAFHTNQAYGRYWEARTQLQAMGSFWADVASECVAFDELVEFKRKYDEEKVKSKVVEVIREVTKTPTFPTSEIAKDFTEREMAATFQAKLVHLTSLLHAVCIQYLLSADARKVELEVLGGINHEEFSVLRKAEDQAFVVGHWLSQLISRRIVAGGVPVPPPILSRVWQILSLGMLAYNQVCKIEDTPFPFPYVQLIYVIDFCLLFVTPVVTICWIQDVVLAVVLTCLAVGGFHAMFVAAGMMEAPFGNGANDLPLVDLHNDFVNRLKNIIGKDIALKLNQMILSNAEISKRMAFKTEELHHSFLQWSAAPSPQLVDEQPMETPGPRQSVPHVEIDSRPSGNIDLGKSQRYTVIGGEGQKQTFHGFGQPAGGDDPSSQGEGHVNIVSCDEALPVGGRRIGAPEKEPWGGKMLNRLHPKSEPKPNGSQGQAKG